MLLPDTRRRTRRLSGCHSIASRCKDPHCSRQDTFVNEKTTPRSKILTRRSCTYVESCRIANRLTIRPPRRTPEQNGPISIARVRKNGRASQRTGNKCFHEGRHECRLRKRSIDRSTSPRIRTSTIASPIGQFLNRTL